MHQPLAPAVPAASLEGAPKDADVIDVAAPAVEEVVPELALVDEVLDLAADSIQLAEVVELAIPGRVVVLADHRTVIDGVSVFFALANDVSCVQNSLLFPVGSRGLERVLVAQLGNNTGEVLRFLFKELHQRTRQLGSRGRGRDVSFGFLRR